MMVARSIAPTSVCGEVSWHMAPQTRLSSRVRIAALSLLHTVLRGEMGFTMGMNLLLMGASLLSGSLAAHLLGPTGRGQLAAIQLWPLAIMTIGSKGIVEAAVCYSGRFRAQSGVFDPRLMITGPLRISSARNQLG